MQGCTVHGRVCRTRGSKGRRNVKTPILGVSGFFRGVGHRWCCCLPGRAAAGATGAAADCPSGCWCLLLFLLYTISLGCPPPIHAPTSTLCWPSLPLVWPEPVCPSSCAFPAPTCHHLPPPPYNYIPVPCRWMPTAPASLAPGGCWSTTTSTRISKQTGLHPPTAQHEPPSDRQGGTDGPSSIFWAFRGAD